MPVSSITRSRPGARPSPLGTLSGHIPARLSAAGPAGAGVVAGAVLLWQGAGLGPTTLVLGWIGLAAAAFLGRRALGAVAAVLLAGWGAGLAFGSAGSPAVDRLWLLVAATLMAATLAISWLRERTRTLEARLETETPRDALTELPNRRSFHQEVVREVHRARRSRNPFSVVLMDCDDFARVNERCGRRAGDATLRQLGTLLDTVTRAVDVTARVDGDGFAFVLPDADEHGALLVAERARVAVEAAFAGAAQPLTLSLGVASFPRDGADADAIVAAADEALYAAQALGGNRSTLYGEEAPDILAARAEVGGPVSLAANPALRLI